LKTYYSLSQVRQEIKQGRLTCRELVQHYLNNIEKKANLNTFLEVYTQEALIKAQEIDAKFSSGTVGKLAGMVIGLKDVLCYQDHSMQCSSKILDGFQSQFTSSAVQRLIEEDAIIIGRQNCDEFAMGSSNENSAFGPVRNPVDPERVPGGSSGGSAASVAAGLCMVSLGSDTGGSVRQPAAFCGVIGMKPTYSRISRYGLTAYASSFDIIGIISKSIEDNALVLEVMAGADDHDSTVSRKEVPRFSQQLDFKGKAKVAYIAETLENEGLSPEIKARIENKIEFLTEQGHQVEKVHFPYLDYVLPTYYILTTAEASSNLARYDGVRYGYRNQDNNQLELMYKKTRSNGFGEEVKRRIMLGTFVLSASYHDAYYTKAQKVRKLIRDYTRELLGEHDFLILPTTPSTAFKLGELTQHPLEMYLADLYTVQASVSGVPAISVPIGVDHTGLPIGMQIMTNDFQEANLFAFSKYILDNSEN